MSEFHTIIRNFAAMFRPLEWLSILLLAAAVSASVWVSTGWAEGRANLMDGRSEFENVCVSAETTGALMSWAVKFTDYPSPAVLPLVVCKPHSFFVKHACNGGPCDVIGWVRDDGVVYLDEKLSGLEDSFTASLIVHELTHILQHQSGKFSSFSCEHAIAREREAYRAQDRYLEAVGALVPNHKPAMCVPAS